MTGTIDLSIEQLRTIAADAADPDWAYRPIRVVIHPVAEQAVKVETRTLSYGDVLQGHYFVLRDGTKLTGKQWNDRRDAIKAQTRATQSLVADMERDGLL